MARPARGVDPGDGVSKDDGPPNAHDHADPGQAAGRSWIQPSRTGSRGGYIRACDDDFRRQFPVLWDFLTLDGINGTARKLGSLTIFIQDGKVKGWLNDKDQGYFAVVSADTFSGLWEALDKGLERGTLEWREDKKWKR